MRMRLSAAIAIATLASATNADAAKKPKAVPVPVAPIADTPLTALAPQAMPARGCAAFLWTTATRHQLAAMALSDPAVLRVVLDGRQTDLPLVAQSGQGGFGFSGKASYRTADLTVTLDMSVATKTDISNGAAVPNATLTLDRPGKDTIVLATGGLIGCP
jgi:hypothetical protein